MSETRDSLSKIVAEATGFSYQSCRDVLDTLLIEIVCRARDGEEVFIPGLGTFVSKPRCRRPYDFHKGQLMPLQAYKSLRFYPDWKFKRRFK